MPPFKKIVFFFLFFFSAVAFTQNKIDSLKKLLVLKKDTAEVNCLNSIAKIFVSFQLDSAIVYTDRAYKKAGLLNYNYGKIRALLYSAAVFRLKGKVDTAIYLYSQVIEKGKKDRFIQEVGEAQMFTAFIFQNQGELDKSVSYLIQAEKSFLETGSKSYLARNDWMLGNTYLKLSSYNEAEKSFEKAKNFFAEIKDSLGYTDCIMNQALVNNSTNKFLSALEKILQCEAFYRRIKHGGALSAALVGKADAYDGLNMLPEREKTLWRP
jgi:tetratricopeptide (TPR) repeat protein